MFSKRFSQPQPTQTQQSASVNQQQLQAAAAPYLYKRAAGATPTLAPAMPQYMRANLSSTERHLFIIGDHSGSMGDLQAPIYGAVAALQAKARFALVAFSASPTASSDGALL